ncbi:cell division protein ZapB [Oceanospirillum sp. HFRX-1_2]
MDTDDLDQLEKQIHELLLICVDLRKENEQLKGDLRQQAAELEALTQEREATEEKVSYLLTRLGPSEPQDE